MRQGKVRGEDGYVARAGRQICGSRVYRERSFLAVCARLLQEGIRFC